MLELRTPRLLLRPFGPENEEVLFRFCNEPQVRRYLCDDLPVSREMVQEQGLKEIWAGADLDNAASFRVMERLGMTRVGERLVGPRQVRALYYRLTCHAC